MATLEKIRKQALVVSVLLALALLVFILETGLSSGKSFFADSRQVVLSIGDEKVKYEEYSNRLKMMQDNMRQNGQAMGDDEQMMLNNQLAQSYISNYATDDIAKKVGLEVSDAELSALIYGSTLPMSPIANQFFSSVLGSNNPDAITGFLKEISKDNVDSRYADAKMQWNITREAIRTDRLNAKIASLLSRSYKINKIDEALIYGDKSRSVQYVRVEPNMSDTTIKVSDDDIKKYYDGHKDLFVSKNPITKINCISVQVVPSGDDYKEAERAMNTAVDQLTKAVTASEVANVLRSYATKFNTPSYFTENELNTLGLNSTDIDFIKTASVGEVNRPMVVNNSYSIIKLTSKDNAPESVSLNVILLDSINSTKADSLLNVIKSGKQSFADMAKAISLDKSSAQNGGKMVMPSQQGMMIDSFSESMLANLGFEDAYKKGFNTPFIKDFGQAKAIVLLSDPKPAVTRYKFAFVSQPVNFSQKTYDEKYAIINNILNGYKNFDDMAKAAAKEGLNVNKDVFVNVNTPSVLNIPSSRQIIRWALYADKGELNPSLYTCGTDYLVIAQTADHIDGKYLPVDMVKDQIKAKLQREKSASSLADKLSKSNKSTLQEYADSFGGVIDSLVGVNYVVRNMGGDFNAEVMTTKIGSLSKPFVSNDQVFVVNPTSEEVLDQSAKKAQTQQMEQSMARQLSYRAFSQIIDDIKVEDNRGRFF